MRYLVIITLTILFAGCATQRKAEKFYKKHPVELAKKSATEFPVRDSLIKGDTIIYYDTLWGLEYRTDTLISEPKIITETKTVTVPKLVTKYVTVRDTIVRENTAKVAALNYANRELSELNAKTSQKLVQVSAERDTFKHERNKWKLRFFLLLFGIGLAYAAKVKFTKKLW
mgnify:FL=1